MKWDLEKIDEIVEFINTELALGRTMKDIEKEDFEVLYAPTSFLHYGSILMLIC